MRPGTHRLSAGLLGSTVTTHWVKASSVAWAFQRTAEAWISGIQAAPGIAVEAAAIHLMTRCYHFAEQAAGLATVSSARPRSWVHHQQNHGG